jgi:isopenicillin N synthase-like dioxygenase
MTIDVPVIDIARIECPETLLALDAACRNWGFFQVTGHGIAQRVFTDLIDAMREFFAQPVDLKRRISRTAENPWGYFDQELTRNTLDWKQIYDFGPADGALIRPQWPASMPGFQPAVAGFYAQCKQLARRLLAAISINLGVVPDELLQHFDARHSSFLRLNYYPVCSLPSAQQLGVNEHTDAGALTVLLQDDQPGLEVLHDGKWRVVEPRRDALVINIGDIVQVWSNDRYRAALHRVIASPDAERFSAPFFFNPSYDTAYAPLPTTTDSLNPARYCTISWREFRALRAAGDYADLGEEVQIAHYSR